jgi:2-polyprenyl-3-methyl-5-hydroxy-6-metoxy-1,4-benzoquinol methylase
VRIPLIPLKTLTPMIASDRSASCEALARGVGRQCRGVTARVTPDPDLWRSDFAGVVRSVETYSTDSFLATPGPYRTVVLLDAFCSSRRESLLSEAWDRIAEGGRLLAVVRNADAVDDDCSEDVFTRRELRKLLRGFGKVRMLKEQPFRWLAMNVLKCDEGERDLAEDNRSRYQVTADLCQGRVLELGCGRGHLVNHAAERGCEVLGVDHSGSKIGEARALYPELEFVEADILELELPEASYDTVLLPEILEHVDEATGARMLERAWSWVSPGGRLVVSAPNEDCIPHPHHIRWFDLETLAGQLRHFGRPCPVVDQPYKWLLVYVDKPLD